VHKQLNAESAKSLLEKAGYAGVPVTVSNTSYRA